jgi:hypothetical protein
MEYSRSFWNTPDHHSEAIIFPQTIYGPHKQYPRPYICLTHNVPGHSRISQTITVKPPSSPRPYMGSQRMSQVVIVYPQSCPRAYMCLMSNIQVILPNTPDHYPYTVIMLQTKYGSHHNDLGNY